MRAVDGWIATVRLLAVPFVAVQVATTEDYRRLRGVGVGGRSRVRRSGSARTLQEWWRGSSPAQR